jgi:hypothetical protein
MSLLMHPPQSSNRSNPHATHTNANANGKANHKHNFQQSQLDLYMIRATGTDKRSTKCVMAARGTGEH